MKKVRKAAAGIIIIIGLFLLLESVFGILEGLKIVTSKTSGGNILTHLDDHVREIFPLIFNKLDYKYAFATIMGVAVILIAIASALASKDHQILAIILAIVLTSMIMVSAIENISAKRIWTFSQLVFYSTSALTLILLIAQGVPMKEMPIKTKNKTKSARIRK